MTDTQAIEKFCIFDVNCGTWAKWRTWVNKVNGWRHLKLLRERMQNAMHNQMQEETVLPPAEV